MLERLLIRERDIQRQEEEEKIRKARYNKRIKKIKKEGNKERSSYLRKENLEGVKWGKGVNTLMRLRCRNLEEENKHWMEEDRRRFLWKREGQAGALYRRM